MLTSSDCYASEVCLNSCSSHVMLLLNEVMIDRRIDRYLSRYII